MGAVAVIVLVGVAEGNNACQMFRFGSPWYGPLGFAALSVLGWPWQARLATG